MARALEDILGAKVSAVCRNGGPSLARAHPFVLEASFAISRIKSEASQLPERVVLGAVWSESKLDARTSKAVATMNRHVLLPAMTGLSSTRFSALILEEFVD